jgi:beta-lactamase regulating signal transducer with metallopeptidase domain
MLMMAAPAITFTWLSHTAHPAAQSEMQSAADATPAAFAAEVAVSSDRFARTVAAQANQSDRMLWLVQAWLVGVALLAARTAGGLFWVARIRRRQIEPLADEIHRLCLAMQRRMGLNRFIRYGLCRGLDAPVVLGWFRPIVLVTAQATTGLTVQQLQAVIAHELAHIRRFDAFANLLQIVAETLLFYHPAVWWVSRRIRTEREVCCDQEALAVCGEPVSYARALALMEEWRAAPAISMAANSGPLAERVLRLLGLSRTSRRTRAAGVGVSVLCVAAALLAGHAFVGAAQATLNEPAPQASNDGDSKTNREVPSHVIASSIVVAAQTPAPARAPMPAAAPKIAAEPAPAPKPVPAVQPKAAPQPAAPTEVAQPVAPSEPSPPRASKAQRSQTQQGKRSYVEDLAAAGFGNLSADELIAMKVQGITPEYIEGVLATGLHPAVDQLIAMKVQGVTSQYVRDTRAVVIEPAVDELIAMKVHEITPEFIRELQAAGLDARYGEDFIAAKLHGITPELIERAVQQGIGDLRLQELIELKNADVL